MSTLEANLELLSTIPEEHQKEIQQFLLMNFCNENPYRPLAETRFYRNLHSRGHVMNVARVRASIK